MDKFDIAIVLAICLCFYGTYRLGSWMERKALTAALVTEIETAYWEGYDDGQQMGRKQGYQVCLNEDYTMKDKY